LNQEPDDPVQESELEGGGLRLSLRARPRPEGEAIAGEAGSTQRERARLITMAWGDRYIEQLLTLALPAVLAPGNLPVFASRFECEFAIVTETKFFNLISASPAIRGLLEHADVLLLPIDDLLSHAYGITLTYALVRGFSDLGDAMVNTHLVFMNADFILADGSYSKLAEVILTGERLVVSPSYCVIQEAAMDQLRSRQDLEFGYLAVPRREMAEIILRHRHNTIRAKTINQSTFGFFRYDQFYWYVNDDALLGRQMPIAVVYMRPERVLTELPTFWDYGVVSEFCPTLKPRVLGDSDDFLMAELRAEETFREKLRLGWPSVDEIAKDLSLYITKDHQDFGRHTVVLHSRDLPTDIEQQKKEFSDFVDQVYRRLAPPIAYLNHPFWVASFPRFAAIRAEQASRFQRREQATHELLGTPQFANRRARMKQLRSRIQSLTDGNNRDGNGLLPLNMEFATRMREAERQYHSQRDLIEREYDILRSKYLRDIDAAQEEITKLASEEGAEINERCGILHTADSPVAPLPTNGEGDGRRSSRLGRLAKLYDSFFGRLPRTTHWHPYHGMLAHANAAIAEWRGHRHGDGVIVVSSGGSFGALLASIVGGRHVNISPSAAGKDLASGLLAEGQPFGLCICDLTLGDLLRFRQILAAVRKHLSSPARVVVLHRASSGADLADCTFEFTRNLFPTSGRSKIYFSGSRMSTFAKQTYSRFLSNCDLSRVSGQLRAAAVLGLCAPLARIGHWREEKRRPDQLHDRCSAMTIVIDFD
jgi:hypothetical protein